MSGGRLSFQLFAHRAGTGSTPDTWVISLHQIIIVSIVIVLTYKNVAYVRPLSHPFTSQILPYYSFSLSSFHSSLGLLTSLLLVTFSILIPSPPFLKGFFFFLMFLTILSRQDLHHWSPNFFGYVSLWVKCFRTYIFVIYKKLQTYEQMWYTLYIYLHIYVYNWKHQLCNTHEGIPCVHYEQP